MTNEVATRAPSAFEQELQVYEPQIRAALPDHIAAARFRRVIVTAVNQNPDLQKADRRSLFIACVRSAQDGLYPDGREAALVVFNSKNKKTGEWVKSVQYLPMVAGIIKRARNSREVASIAAYVVYANDKFAYRLGDDPKIEHEPALTDRGKPIAVYAVAKLTNGETLREIMSVEEVEQVRAVSRAKDDGPWVQWWAEMARKSAIKRLAKRLPTSADVDEVLAHEEEQYAEPEPPSSRHRPARADFPSHVEPEPETPTDPSPPKPLFAVIDMDGEERQFEDPHAAVACLTAALAAAKTADEVVGLVESNSLRSQFREHKIDALAGACDSLIEAAEKRVKAKVDEKPKESPATGEVKSPPSPLKTKKPDTWQEWVGFWLVALPHLNTHDRDRFAAEQKAELAFLKENRHADYERIEAALKG